MVGAPEEAATGAGKSEGHIITNLNASMIGITSAIVCSRLYVRFFMIKARGWDDFLVMIAFPLVVAVSSIEILMVRYGSGSHVWTVSDEQLGTWFSLMPMNAMVGFLASGFVRLSILAFLPRLCINGAHMKYVWGASFVVVFMTITSFLIFLLACMPISETFHVEFPDLHCVASKAKAITMWTHSVLGACLDVILFGLPIWIVRTTMVFNPKAIKVILVFAFSLLAVVTGITKTCMLMTTDFSVDPTYKSIRVCTWNVIEIHVGLWCASFPALQPLLRLIYLKLKPLSQRQSISSSYLQTNSQRSDPPGQHSSGERGGGLGREQDGSSGRALATSDTDSTMDTIHLEDVKTGSRANVDILVRVEEGVYPRGPDEARLKWGPV
ncbi:hypothetical protein ACJZ2D_015752 [Fusarium nematophilum]